SAFRLDPAWDGHRVLATRKDQEQRLASIDFKEWTATFPSIARALAALPARSLALDGVVCAMDPRGSPVFERLRQQVAGGKPVTSAVLIAWDLIWIDDDDLRARPLRERLARLASLLAGAPPAILASQPLEGAPSAVLAAVSRLGIEGLVARRN